MFCETNKDDLATAAAKLATAELGIRLYNKGTNLEDLHHLTKQVNDLRAASPMFAEKEFWWDVPFDAELPQELDKMSFFMENGFFFEGDEIVFATLSGSGKMFSEQKYKDVIRLLDDYMVFNQSYIPLYMDKKQMRKYLKERLLVRKIYHCCWDDVTYRRKDPLEGNAAYIELLRNSYQRDMAKIDAQMQERLVQTDRRIDQREMLFNLLEHNALMTSKETYLHDRMSTREFLSDTIWRYYDMSDIRQKAIQEQQRRRSEYEQKMQEYRRLLNQSGTYTKVKEALLHIMAVGEAVYFQDQLLALVVYNNSEPVYEIQCAPDFNLLELNGNIYSYRILFEKSVDQIPLFHHLLEYYGDFLPMYHPLDSRPRNCPDAQWRMWAEVRWAQTLALLQEI